jgi:hypothetical protein
MREVGIVEHSPRGLTQGCRRQAEREGNSNARHYVRARLNFEPLGGQ